MSMPFSQRPPRTYLQLDKLDLLFIAVTENTDLGEPWIAQYEDVRKTLLWGLSFGLVF